MTDLLHLAKRHCHSSKPALTLKAFVRETYGVGWSFFHDVTAGRRKPSPRLIHGMRATHVRLFPTEPFPIPAPENHPHLN